MQLKETQIVEKALIHDHIYAGKQVLDLNAIFGSIPLTKALITIELIDKPLTLTISKNTPENVVEEYVYITEDSIYLAIPHPNNIFLTLDGNNYRVFIKAFRL